MSYFASFYEKHRGKSGVVIGGGFSLKKQTNNLPPLKEHHIIIGVNKAYKLLTPHYLWFSDQNFWIEFSFEIQDLHDCIVFFPAEYTEVKGGSQGTFIPVETERTLRSENQLLIQKQKRKLLLTGGSGLCGLRIASFLGLDPIYLLGMDCCISENGNQHFHTDYDDKSWGLACPKWYENCFYHFKETLKILNKVRVISCSPNSRLNTLIPYKDILVVHGE